MPSAAARTTCRRRSRSCHGLAELFALLGQFLAQCANRLAGHFVVLRQTFPARELFGHVLRAGAPGPNPSPATGSVALVGQAPFFDLGPGLVAIHLGLSHKLAQFIPAQGAVLALTAALGQQVGHLLFLRGKGRRFVGQAGAFGFQLLDAHRRPFPGDA